MLSSLAAARAPTTRGDTIRTRITRALRACLHRDVVDADWTEDRLHGGTLGDVRLLTGTARTASGETIPFRLVHKTQHRWERHGDPGSWRREHDLFTSNLGSAFSTGLRWPTCYDAEIDEQAGVIHLVLEHVEGVSGRALSTDAQVRAARELGRLQGRLAVDPLPLEGIDNLSSRAFAEGSYRHYRSWPRVHDYIRSPDCALPRHLSDMLVGLDEDAENVLARLAQLPVVLCHRDFWNANIIDTGSQIVLIDWDTAGWGWLGEDLASLLADDVDASRMVELYRRCLPAYYAGVAESLDLGAVHDDDVVEMILLIFGYRLVEEYLDADDPATRADVVERWEQIARMRALTHGDRRLDG